MSSELREELRVRPLDGQSAAEPAGAGAEGARSSAAELPPSKGDALSDNSRPGDGQASRSSVEALSGSGPTTAAASTAIVKRQHKPLEARLQDAILELFGPDPSSALSAWGPHYPCPINGRSWQLSLWSRTSARFDRRRPAVVVTRVAVRSEPVLRVKVRWLSANVPAADLWVQLTDAPPGINQPGPAGRSHFDVRPDPAEQERGEAVVYVRGGWHPPARFYVRVYSCKGIEFGGTFLGFEFGSSLRSLSASGDDWGLARGSTKRPAEGNAEATSPQPNVGTGSTTTSKEEAAEQHSVVDPPSVRDADAETAGDTREGVATAQSEGRGLQSDAGTCSGPSGQDAEANAADSGKRQQGRRQAAPGQKAAG